MTLHAEPSNVQRLVVTRMMMRLNTRTAISARLLWKVAALTEIWLFEDALFYSQFNGYPRSVLEADVLGPECNAAHARALRRNSGTSSSQDALLAAIRASSMSSSRAWEEGPAGAQLCITAGSLSPEGRELVKTPAGICGLWGIPPQIGSFG